MQVPAPAPTCRGGVKQHAKNTEWRLDLWQGHKLKSAPRCAGDGYFKNRLIISLPLGRHPSPLRSRGAPPRQCVQGGNRVISTKHHHIDSTQLVRMLRILPKPWFYLSESRNAPLRRGRLGVQFRSNICSQLGFSHSCTLAGATVFGYFTVNEKIRVRIPACSSIGRALTADALDLGQGQT